MVLVADAVLASAVSLWSTLFQTIMAASVRLGRCLRHASAFGCSWKNFLSFALAWFAFGIWCIISVVLVLAVTDTGVWALLLSSENWILFVFLDAMLGSTVDTVYMLCVSTLAMEVFHTFSSLRKDSNADSVSSPFG